ncbi:hypothetical protein F4679DRAFT_582840 [Xylaria curta]|nr:hypothetical protein F4679DRAFT_582840 [Xylaria curta]
MHFLSVVAVAFIAQVALASSSALERRAEERSRCDSPTECKYSYTTGSAQCDSGFQRFELKAYGSPEGSYCERDCSEGERTACVSDNCQHYEHECNKYPMGSGSCATAVEWCDGPVAMLKSTCTAQTIGQTVTYDDDKHLCIPEGKTADSRQTSPIRLGPGAVFNAALVDPSVTTSYLNVKCFNIAYPDAKSLAEWANTVTNGCTTKLDKDEGNTGYETLNVECESPKDTWNDVREVLSQICWQFNPFDKRGPFANWLEFYGRPIY